MLKAIIEVYSELLETNFYTQISCSRHSKFVKILPIFMHLTVSAVFVYLSFPASTKLIWSVTFSPKLRAKVMDQLNFVQQLQIANQKGYSDFDTGRSS